MIFSTYRLIDKGAFSIIFFRRGVYFYSFVYALRGVLSDIFWKVVLISQLSYFLCTFILLRIGPLVHGFACSYAIYEDALRLYAKEKKDKIYLAGLLFLFFNVSSVYCSVWLARISIQSGLLFHFLKMIQKYKKYIFWTGGFSYIIFFPLLFSDAKKRCAIIHNWGMHFLHIDI